MEKKLLKGTTTVGLTYKDGIVMATEHRATMGTLIAHKKTQKLFRITEHLGLTTAGLVGDAQVLARYLRAEAELYALKRNTPITVRAASTLMANILNARKYYPYWVQLIIAGVDDEGGHVYSLDAAGGSIPDTYVTTGSGSPYVYGVLEDHFKENMTKKDTVDLAIRGITAAMKRDAASGNGIDVATISQKAGWNWISGEEIEKRISAMGLK
ncbi:MAG: archaeal proteasome endopeptidase complex subunit beta [Candidatus Thermoplasmatota archaeon]|jgi:proteasome beta subunit|nr:archaeal proteasome endopeptidase complex subunit beta [Candidatus Thermoplasmatota archaeon]MDP7266517.1 archaeal proteasome endopeptidase complex subunit beta [Candidatus Thermoplasmatota archaeon]